MTIEDAQQYLKTRQLSDYKESWSTKQKGCLFFVGIDVHKYSSECYFKIVDFHWRKGAKWEDYPQLLPYEKDELYAWRQRDYWFRLSHFGAFLLAYIIEHGVPCNSDLHVLWDTYIQQSANKYYNPVISEYARYSWTCRYHKDDIFQLVKDLNLSMSDGQPPLRKFLESWKSAISFWVDKYIADMTPQKQLFNFDMHFKVNEVCSYNVPIRVYDQAEVDEDDVLGSIHCDEINCYEEGEETYTTKDVMLTYDSVTKSLVLEYDVPEAYEKKATDFDYDESDETFTATDFEEDFTNDKVHVEEPIAVWGLTALILGYSANEMVIRAYRSKDKWTALSKFVNSSDSWHIQDIKIYVTQSVYDTYFENFCKEYEQEHISDSDFIVLRKQKKVILLLEEAIKSEQKNIEQSWQIDSYLTKEQANQLHKDVNNYIVYLQGRLSELQPNQEASHNVSYIQAGEVKTLTKEKFQYIKSNDPSKIKEIEDTMAIYIRGNRPSELCRYLFQNVGNLFLDMPKHSDVIYTCINDHWGNENKITKPGLKVAWKRHKLNLE